jgi:Amt family ammonium transporter
VNLPVWAQAPDQASSMIETVSTAGFLLLLPLGLALMMSSALPDAIKEAPEAVTTGLVIWGIAIVAYFLVGFAFQFGGLAVNSTNPDFAELYWNWSPLDTSFGTGWGVIGLRGWALAGGAGTPGVYDLFLRHVALLGVAAVVPSFILYRRLPLWVMGLFGVLIGTIMYPLVGNWIWSGGWLANLGLTQGFGHGFIDAGIASPLALTGFICLAALIAFRSREATKIESSPLDHPTKAELFVEVPMPRAYLPLLSFVGLVLILWSWAFLAGARHIPTAASIAMPRAALNGFLSTFAGALAAALYSRFTTARFNPLMTMRGALTGLVAVSTVAPFIPPWQALVIGVVVGLLVPLMIYLVDHRLHLADHTATVGTFVLIGMVAWLLPGLLADGSTGMGWNNTGQGIYLGVENQGISGLFVAPGYIADWPGQLLAQLFGLAAISAWSFFWSFALFKSYLWLAQQQTHAEKRVGEPVKMITETQPTEENVVADAQA